MIVSSGLLIAAVSGTISNGSTDKSPGTSRPSRCRPAVRPSAASSFITRIAVDSGWSRKICAAASCPARVVSEDSTTTISSPCSAAIRRYASPIRTHGP
jgi:hypothetical protein